MESDEGDSQCFGSGSGESGTFWVETEAGAIFENHLEAKAEALVKKKIGSGSRSDLKKIWVEAEAEAIFFSLWKRKRKRELLNLF